MEDFRLAGLLHDGVWVWNGIWWRILDIPFDEYRYSLYARGLAFNIRVKDSWRLADIIDFNQKITKDVKIASNGSYKPVPAFGYANADKYKVHCVAFFYLDFE